MDDSTSIESLLSVPFEYIFPTNPTHKIFSLNEAKELLQVSLKAAELDCLLVLATRILHRQGACQRSTHRLKQVICCSNEHEEEQQPSSTSVAHGVAAVVETIPMSVACRALLPVLLGLSSRVLKNQYSYIQSQIAQALLDLQQSSKNILGFYEQFEACTDQLQQTAAEFVSSIDDSFNPLRRWWQQKQMAGEIFHTLHTRIEHFLISLKTKQSPPSSIQPIPFLETCRQLEEQILGSISSTTLSLPNTNTGLTTSTTTQQQQQQESNSSKRKRSREDSQHSICLDAKQDVKRWKEHTTTTTTSKGNENILDFSQSHMNAAAVLAHIHTSSSNAT